MSNGRAALVAVLAAASLLVASCASPGGDPAEAIAAPAAAPVTTTSVTTTAPAPAPDPADTITSTTTLPPDPYETFVAAIRPEVDVLEAFVEPDGEPAHFEFPVTNPTYFGNPLRLMVVDRTDDGRWVKVQVPVRPNGTEAWIRADDAEITSHRYRAVVNVPARSVAVWNGPDLVVETGAVVGKDATPTPLGSFFVNDLVEKWEGSAYGPDILSLSAFSEALDTFAGGIPVIAIHGTNRPDLIGGAYSNGCIRVPNEVIRVLADTVPIGTPVDIVG